MLPELFSKYDLTIFDRNYNDVNTNNKFPATFNDYIVGMVRASEIKNVYKGYRVCLNANSIADSDTMFARRVVESLACNTPIVSSKSRALDKLFSHEIVSSNNKEILVKEVAKLFDDEQYYKQKQIAGVRKVFAKYTTTKFVEKLLTCCNIRYIESNEDISIISYCKSDHEVNDVVDMFKKQTYSNSELIVYLVNGHSYKTDIASIASPKIKFIYDNELKYVSDISTKYISFWNSLKKYNQHFIEDMLNSYKYIDDDVLSTTGCSDEYTYTSSFNITNSVFKCTFLKNVVLLNVFTSTNLTIIDKNIKVFNINNYKNTEDFDV